MCPCLRLPTMPLHFIFVGVVFLLMMFLLKNYKAWWISIFVFVLLFFICLITDAGINRTNYGYILSPAWRLLHGFGLNQSYCQYEYFLPILAALWIKFFSVETISLLVSISFLGLLFGAYLFAKKFFNHKQLACYLLISLGIVKIYGYAPPWDNCLQTTPWRLDWWIVLLVLAYWKTAYHWTLGAGLGLLIIFHHPFGCIYTASYFIFILMLIILEMSAGKNSLRGTFKKYSLLYSKNFIFIIAAFLIYRLFLQPPINTAVYFQKTGIGFMPISPHSFYWYMPVMFASVFLLLCKNRPLLSQKFFETAIFLLSLVIGNSMYFFGRSHEFNIINIAAGLLMVSFLFFDLLHFELKQLSFSKFTRWGVPLAASMFVLVLSCQYAHCATSVLYQQFLNLRDHRLCQPR